MNYQNSNSFLIFYFWLWKEDISMRITANVMVYYPKRLASYSAFFSPDTKDYNILKEIYTFLSTPNTLTFILSMWLDVNVCSLRYDHFSTILIYSIFNKSLLLAWHFSKHWQSKLKQKYIWSLISWISHSREENRHPLMNHTQIVRVQFWQWLKRRGAEWHKILLQEDLT